MDLFNLGEAFPEVSDYISLTFLLLFSLFDCSPFSLQELQKAVDQRKAIILSIHLCSSEFTQPGREESQDLQDRLSQMNGRWNACAPCWRSGGVFSRMRSCSARSVGLWAGHVPESNTSSVAESVTQFIKITRGMQLLPKVSIHVR